MIFFEWHFVEQYIALILDIKTSHYSLAMRSVLQGHEYAPASMVVASHPSSPGTLCLKKLIKLPWLINEFGPHVLLVRLLIPDMINSIHMPVVCMKILL
jgi:hypothetical protein